MPGQANQGPSPPKGFDQVASEEHSRKISENHNRAELANKALEYLCLQEALGRPPTLKEFGKGGFEHRAAEAGVGAEAEAAFTRYERIVHDACAGNVDALRDEGKQERDTGRTRYGKKPHETNDPPAVQLDDGKNEAKGQHQKLDTATQRQPEDGQEKSWWQRLFGG